MNILIAPNSFKNSISAEEAAMAIEEGFKLSSQTFNCEKFPVGDGGDGTANIIIEKFFGEYIKTKVQDPLGRNIDSSFGIINGDTAVIEMANASGLRLLNPIELNPLIASTYGTGQQIIQALDQSVTKIIIAMGGSATVDGGWGILRALGIKFVDLNNNELIHLSTSLSAIDVSGLDKRLRNIEIIVLCDVKNKLLGDEGAAAVFGPQKGATAQQVLILDKALTNYARIVYNKFGININIERCGTAGGASAGLYAFLNARLVNGIDYFLQLTNFEQSLNHADIVITGEGSIDEQTLQGKAPFGVALRGKEKGLKVIALAGKVPTVPGKELSKYFDILKSINSEPVDLSTALKNTYANLVHAAKNIGDQLMAEK